MKSAKPTYNKYLQLNKILDAQDRLSVVLDKPIHDEMLFIIIHQIYELWFKQIIHEIDSIIYYFKNPKVTETNINTIVGRLNRIHDIQKIAITQIDILKSMTPMDFLEFRDLLNPASGFQSTQFRIIENALGLKTDSRIKFSKQKYTNFLPKTEVKLVEKYEQNKNLFDLVEGWLERTPFIESEEFNFWKSYKKAIKKMLDDDLKIIRKNPNLDKTSKTEQIENYKKNIRNMAEAGLDFIIFNMHALRIYRTSTEAMERGGAKSTSWSSFCADSLNQMSSASAMCCWWGRSGGSARSLTVRSTVSCRETTSS